MIAGERMATNSAPKSAPAATGIPTLTPVPRLRYPSLLNIREVTRNCANTPTLVVPFAMLIGIPIAIKSA